MSIKASVSEFTPKANAVVLCPTTRWKLASFLIIIIHYLLIMTDSWYEKKII